MNFKVAASRQSAGTMSIPTQSRGVPLKSVRDILREDDRLIDDFDRLPSLFVTSDVPPFQGGDDFVVIGSWAFTSRAFSPSACRG